MSKNHYQSIDNNCDGFGCDSKAISKLQVKVGETRTISLSLCESCRTKFNEVDRSDAMMHQEHADSNIKSGDLMSAMAHKLTADWYTSMLIITT